MSVKTDKFDKLVVTVVALFSHHTYITAFLLLHTKELYYALNVKACVIYSRQDFC